MPPRTPRAALAAALLAVAACATSGIKVDRYSDEQIAPRPPDCGLEYLKDPPQRPYDQLAELETHVTSPAPGPYGALEALRPTACELGADALIVQRNFVTNEFGHAIVAGIAIKYRAAQAAPPPPAEPAPAEPPAVPLVPGGATNL